MDGIDWNRKGLRGIVVFIYRELMTTLTREVIFIAR